MKKETLIFLLVAGVTLFAVMTYSSRITPPTEAVSNEVRELPGDAGIDGKTWLLSFDQAKQLSESTGRPILADFTGSDWCGWCIRLDEEIFSHPVFQKWASEKVILLKLDYPQKTPQPPAEAKQNQTLMSVYRISGFPTILFLDAKGTPLGRSGYISDDPREWIAHAQGKLGA